MATQRAIRHGFPPDHGLRVHRAPSRLHRAGMVGEDRNAAYPDELNDVTLARGAIGEAIPDV